MIPQVRRDVKRGSSLICPIDGDQSKASPPVLFSDLFCDKATSKCRQLGDNRPGHGGPAHTRASGPQERLPYR
jgi:hypothetical protein